MASVLVDKILSDLTILQSIPAPTFDEIDRASYVYSRFNQESLQQVKIDGTGNVLGFIPGGSAKPVVISAHMDTVHSKIIDHSILRDGSRWTAPGIGDNTLSIATLIGLANHLCHSPHRLPGGVWLIATVGEEGLGNLAGMRAICDQFGDSVQAYICLEGIGLGTIFNTALGIKRFEITYQTAGGHAWGDYGNFSAIELMAQFIVQSKTIAQIFHQRCSVNFGKIGGGTTINSIANHAVSQFELRSNHEEILNRLVEEIRAVSNPSADPSIRVEMKEIGSRPFGGIPEDHWLVTKAIEALREEGITARLSTGSTDASYPLSLGLPAICIGLTEGWKSHSLEETIDISKLGYGVDQILRLLPTLWE